MQGCIAHLLGRQFFQVADPDKGRFRSYLLTSLNHFLADAAERAGRLKRGERHPPLSLDVTLAERRYAQEPANPSDRAPLDPLSRWKGQAGRSVTRLAARTGCGSLCLWGGQAPTDGSGIMLARTSALSANARSDQQRSS